MKHTRLFDREQKRQQADVRPPFWRLARLLGTAATLLLAGMQASAAETPTAQLADDLKARWNLDVRWGEFGPVVFPLTSSIVAVPLQDGVPAALQVIRTALSGYSDGYVRDHAAVSILLCQALAVSGVPVGGLSRLTEQYVLARDAGTPDGSASLRRVVDDMAAFPIGDEHALDITVWALANAPGFSYASAPYHNAEIVPLDRPQAGPNERKTLNDAGLLSPLGTVSLWRDVDDYAEWAFEEPAALAATARNFPRVRAKVLLLMDAYEVLDAGMRDAFMRSGLARLRTEHP